MARRRLRCGAVRAATCPVDLDISAAIYQALVWDMAVAVVREAARPDDFDTEPVDQRARLAVVLDMHGELVAWHVVKRRRPLKQAVDAAGIDVDERDRRALKVVAEPSIEELEVAGVRPRTAFLARLRIEGELAEAIAD